MEFGKKMVLPGDIGEKNGVIFILSDSSESGALVYRHPFQTPAKDVPGDSSEQRDSFYDDKL